MKRIDIENSWYSMFIGIFFPHYQCSDIGDYQQNQSKIHGFFPIVDVGGVYVGDVEELPFTGNGMGNVVDFSYNFTISDITGKMDCYTNIGFFNAFQGRKVNITFIPSKILHIIRAEPQEDGYNGIEIPPITVDELGRLIKEPV